MTRTTSLVIAPKGSLHGSVQVPGDKSISHRALIFAALCEGATVIEGLSTGADVRQTAECLKLLGVSIVRQAPPVDTLTVHGVGLDGLKPPPSTLDCGNSGTTMRLLAGLLAGSGVGGVLDGDDSLRRRPMRRVLSPLRSMGAVCQGARNDKGDETAPLRFAANAWLVGKDHHLDVSSAQVKTALLLAGLWADGTTRVKEPTLSRDHTERMLLEMGAPLHRHEDGSLSIQRPTAPLQLPETLRIPGDPSSAAFLLAAAAILPGSDLEITGLSGNPTRLGFLRALERMGARLVETVEGHAAGDPLITVRIEASPSLRGVEIGPDEIPSLVDEIPLLAVVATQAEGRTSIRGAGELRVKESDRLAAITGGLKRMGADITETEDGLEILGPTLLRGAEVEAHDDHRIAMSLAVAAWAAEGRTTLHGAEWADISFPGFYDLVDTLARGTVRP